VGLSHDSPQPRATNLGPQQRLTPPHGRVRSRHVSRESDIPQGLKSESEPPWESAGPLDIQSGPPRLVQDLHVCKPDPWNGIRTPRMGSGPPTMGSQGLRTEHTQALNMTQAEVRRRHMSGPSLVGSGPVCIYSCSPLRQRPDAATWHTARGLSQRAEPSMTPLDHARLRIHYGYHVCLSIPLIGGVHSPRYADRAVIYHYSYVSAINAAWTTVIKTPGDCSGVTSINYSHNVFLLLCSWARMSGLSILVCAFP
jgi:hypothetical protein